MSEKKIEGIVEEVDLKKIIPYWRNARKSNNVDLVKKSIEEFGYNNFIVVDANYTIIAGHSRYKALTELGYKKIKIIKTNLSEHEAKKYRLVDNKVQEKNEWLYDDLKIELRDLGEDFLIKETFGVTMDSIKEVNFTVPSVTIDQVNKQDEKLATSFQQTSKARNEKQEEADEIICPHCMKSFLYH